jgi:fibronectin-binding autotransporter adhesin
MPIGAVAAVFLLAICASSTDAAPYYYTGGSGTADAPVTGVFSGGFSDGTNNGLTPVSDSTTTLSFAGASYDAVDDLTNQLLVSALTFSNTGTVDLSRGTDDTASNSLQLNAATGYPIISFNNTPGIAGLVTIDLDISLSAATILSGSGSAELNGNISGGGGLIKNGSGTVTLTGANNYAGATVVNSGTLNLDFSAANAPQINIIHSSSMIGLTLGGGNLTLIGNNNLSNSQTFNGLTISNGSSSVQMIPNGNLLSLSFNSISHSTGGTVDFALSGTSTSTNGIRDSLNSISNGIIGGWATVNGGTDWATLSNGSVVAYTAYTAFPASGNGSTSANYLLSGSGSINNNFSANTIKIASTDDGQSLELGANTLTFSNKGGLLYVGGSGNSYAINGGGTIGCGLGGLGTEFNITTTSGNLTINTQITGAAINLVKTGAGTLTLTNANNNFGSNSTSNNKIYTYIDAGTLNINNDNNLGAQPGASAGAPGVIINFNGGTLQTASGVTSSRAIVLGANGGTIDTNGSDSTFSGNVTDASGVQGALTKSGDGTLTLSGTNSYSGGTTVNGGVITGGTSSYGSGNVTVNSGATVDYTQSDDTTGTASNNISGPGSVTVGGNSASPNGTGGTVNYTGQDSASGGTTVQSGTLALQNPTGAALAGPVAISAGAKVQMGAENQIAPTANVTLNGGTLDANGHSDGAISGTDPTTAAVTSHMGTLNLGSDPNTVSTLDFGATQTSDSSVLAFADSSAMLGSGRLNVVDYIGGKNSLYIGASADLSQPQLNQIAYNGMYGMFSQLNNGEIVLSPTPEPSGLVSALVGTATLGGVIGMRRRKTVAQAA